MGAIPCGCNFTSTTPAILGLMYACSKYCSVTADYGLWVIFNIKDKRIISRGVELTYKRGQVIIFMQRDIIAYKLYTIYVLVLYIHIWQYKKTYFYIRQYLYKLLTFV